MTGQQLEEHPFSPQNAIFQDINRRFKSGRVEFQERELCHSHGDEIARWRTSEQMAALCLKISRMITQEQEQMIVMKIDPVF